jgi:hypothetical protein
MARPFDDVHNRTAQAAKVSAQPLGGPPAVLSVRRERADAGDGEKLVQLAQHAILLALDKAPIH